MNGSPDFDLESESSNSVGINTPVQFDLRSPEPEINSFLAFSSHTPVETQNEPTSNSVPVDTSLAQAKFSGRSQFCGDNDSDNSDIQNFVRILGRCTYSGNLESEKEDSWNQIESKKKDFAASQLPEGLALLIQYENKPSNNEVIWIWVNMRAKIVDAYLRVRNPPVSYFHIAKKIKELLGQQEVESKLQLNKNYSRRKIPHFRSVVQEVMKLRSMQNAVEPVLEPFIRRLVKEEVEMALRK